MLLCLVFKPFAAEKHKPIFQRFHIEVINLRITLKLGTSPLSTFKAG